jgi:AraC-like DNA-binding protein
VGLEPLPLFYKKNFPIFAKAKQDSTKTGQRCLRSELDAKLKMKGYLSHNDDAFNNRTTIPEVLFKHYEIRDGKEFGYLNSDTNHLIFLLAGMLCVHCNDLPPTEIRSKELFLIPKSSEFTLKPRLPGSLIVCSFDSLYSIRNKLILRIYATVLPLITYSFAPLSVNHILEEYLSILQMYLQKGMDSDFLYKIKFQELFLLFEHFYHKEQMAGLLYPILGQSLDFKNQVMQYFPHVGNVDELARKIGMGRATFDIKFKKEFGMSPLQWILKEKAKHVYFSLSEPENTLSDIMKKYNFNSSTHLNRFCRQQFGCTPSELRKRLTTID